MRKAIVVDLDGTLVANQHRQLEMYRNPDGSMDWERWISDAKYDPMAPWCHDLVIGMADQGYHIVFLTGRRDLPMHREITDQWLRSRLLIPSNEWTLVMRPATNEQDDHVMKLALYNQQVLPFFDVQFAIDDKLSNCQMFRDLGIISLHCADY